MAAVEITGLTKIYNNHRAIEEVTLSIADGEFMTLLGPSGCGKSTTLNALAGLDTPTSGRIVVGDRVFYDSANGTNLLAEERNCGLVFQSYALWPHLSVAANVAFPLELRRVPRAERLRRVEEVLALVEMEAMGGRYPHELSGGQQQRVALARTLVYRPTVLLLDEPLSNLDAKLREKARFWLTQVQDQVKLTTIYVTHDQVEALAMSDRITVMNGGRVVQVGTPQEIYETPSDPFVADFIGTTSFITGTVSGRDGNGLLDIAVDGGTIRSRLQGSVVDGARVVVAIRPEHVQVVEASASIPTGDGSLLEAEIVARSYLGARHQLELALGQARIRVDVAQPPPPGPMRIWLPTSASIAFPAST